MPDDAAMKSKSPIAPYWDLLGKVPDAEIAKMAGVKPATVALTRRAKGISPAPPSKKTSPLAQWEDLLGKVPDSKIAEMAGMSRSAVRYHRVYTHGILHDDVPTVYGEPMPRWTIKIPAEDKKMIEERAKAEGISMNQYVRNVIREHLGVEG